MHLGKRGIDRLRDRPSTGRGSACAHPDGGTEPGSAREELAPSYGFHDCVRNAESNSARDMTVRTGA